MIREWGAKHGFQLFAPEGHRSYALTCFATPETLDLSGFIKALKTKYNFLINGGYGKIKGTTFRILLPVPMVEGTPFKSKGMWDGV
jgi:aspartate aminotransferase-like enzyme